MHSAAWGGGELRDSPSRKSSAQFAAPILSGSGCGVRPGHQRCPAASPATLRVARARPLPLRYEVRPRCAPLAPLKRRPRRGRRFSESRYSLSAYSSSPPAVSSNELRRVAVRRARWRRTARFKEPQELGQQRGPKHSPILRPVSASLRLRCRSAAFSRALRDSSIFGAPPK